MNFYNTSCFPKPVDANIETTAEPTVNSDEELDMDMDIENNEDQNMQLVVYYLKYSNFFIFLGCSFRQLCSYCRSGRRVVNQCEHRKSISLLFISRRGRLFGKDE